MFVRQRVLNLRERRPLDACERCYPKILRMNGKDKKLKYTRLRRNLVNRFVRKCRVLCAQRCALELTVEGRFMGDWEIQIPLRQANTGNVDKKHVQNDEDERRSAVVSVGG